MSPVGFLSIFVVPARFKKIRKKKPNCIKQLVLEKDPTFLGKSVLTGMAFIEICSVKIARGPPPGRKMPIFVEAKTGGTVSLPPCG